MTALDIEYLRFAADLQEMDEAIHAEAKTKGEAVPLLWLKALKRLTAPHWSSGTTAARSPQELVDRFMDGSAFEAMERMVRRGQDTDKALGRQGDVFEPVITARQGRTD